MTAPTRDYTAELELYQRRDMERSSELLLNALRDQHPRIIALLTRQHNERRL